MKFGLADATIDRINAIFALEPAIERVLLYGSRAKGTFRPGSDIDLTIIEHGMTASDLSRIERRLDDLSLPYTIDLSLFGHLKHPELIAHINRVGTPFYGREALL